jgi:uncharacterized protein
MVPIIVVAILAVVQSFFGVGLLVFGTPTLLLLGYSFPQTLATLLPASVAISLLQVWDGPKPSRTVVREFAGWCLVPMVTTMATVLFFELRASLNLAVAVLLALFAILRMFPRLSAIAAVWVARYERPWLVAMGVVHGWSNLGGGLLVILAASRYREKSDIRAFIAFCYACFATAQLAVLALLTPAVLGPDAVGYAAVGAAVFIFVGQKMFRWVPSQAFERLLTLIVAGYAGVLALRSAGLW